MSIRQSQDYRYATGALLCPINTINVLFTTLLRTLDIGTSYFTLSIVSTIIPGIPCVANIWRNFWIVTAEVGVSTTCASSHLEWASIQ